VVSVAYVSTDRDARIMETLGDEMRLFPVLNGVPSGLEFSGGASLPPGEYTLKVAVAEGDRVGTIEHPVRAGLVTAGDLTLSELLAGGPPDIRDLYVPTIGHTVAYGAVHGYLEAYGPGAAALTAKYEIAADAESPAILSAAAPARTAGDQRVIFSGVMLVRQLPPGPYVLRAVVSSADAPVKTMIRGFEVAPPRVLIRTCATAAVRAWDPGFSALAPAVIDVLHARVGYRAREQSAEHHALGPEILGIFGRAGDLGHHVVRDEILADVFEVGHHATPCASAAARITPLR